MATSSSFRFIRKSLFKHHRKSGFALFFAAMFVILLACTITSFYKYGPYFSPDTVNYFRIASGTETSMLANYSPLYPALLYLISRLFSLSVFEAASLLVAMGFISGLLIIFRLSKTLLPETPLRLYFPLAISFLAWWSFRVMVNAHADGIMYLLLLAWLYVGLLVWKSDRLSHFWWLGIIGSIMIWAKINAIFLLPVVVMIYFFTQNIKWRIPAFCLILSLGAYFYFFQENILVINIGEGLADGGRPLDHAKILFNNISALFKVSLGYFVSDLVTESIPTSLAFVMGTVLLGAAFTRLPLRNRQDYSHSLALLALTYAVLFLSFQQWMLYEEINYRTLFPYLLAGGWAVWIRWSKQKHDRIMFIACVLISGHTFLGHLHLWQRPSVSSLFEVSGLAKSGLPHALRGITHQNRPILTDFPEKAELLLIEDAVPRVDHVNPESLFIKGKRRFLNEQQRDGNLRNSEEMLSKGKAVLVLFKADDYWESFAIKAGLNFVPLGNVTLIYSD
ncbi:hypothetical protein [Negadavirga shengliensis]|uniref:Glycosyltransferase RgtA/B/C/D-like domain-containing protein n=1 Tax=Negadavirga shengliensis TaxID=1389218 RepID=A0ABV9T849_9BACT